MTQPKGKPTCSKVRALAPVLAAALLLQALWGCNYARMKDDEAVNTYQTTMPRMPQSTVPTTGGYEILKETSPNDLKNPLPLTRESVEQGREAYGFFCIQCHGPHADGFGTVGQSFAPLPTDLRTPYVQSQSDGMLFYRISFGFKREPPLASTVSVEDRWAVINYIRSIAPKTGG